MKLVDFVHVCVPRIAGPWVMLPRSPLWSSTPLPVRRIYWRIKVLNRMYRLSVLRHSYNAYQFKAEWPKAAQNHSHIGPKWFTVGCSYSFNLTSIVYVPSVSRSRDISRCVKFLKRVAWPWPRPLQGWFFIGRVRLAMVNLNTKFEVSRCSVTKLWWMAGQNAENMVVSGHSRSWGMSPFDRARTTSYSTLIETMQLSRFRDAASYLSKSRILTVGVTPVEFRGAWGRMKAGSGE